ncbi:MAG: hypothetical protein EOP54_07650 [Sphingobacteriales bacterium]|nr:MAG: hypothetical protein EOP54_07650 [Sphingobacteriales bacterium]
MINRNNIVEFISFLYQKKFNQPAPQDLLDSWSGLNDNETTIHLNGLYRHWNLDAISSKNYEQEFLGRTQGAAHTPIFPAPEAPVTGNTHYQQPTYPQNPAPQQQYTQPQPPVPPVQKKGGSGWIIGILLAVIAAGAGYYIWNLNQKDTSAPPDVTATDNNIKKPDTVQKVTAPVEAAKPAQTEEDKKNGRVIHDLLYAESGRSFDDIYKYFDPNLERYWGINYPTYDELRAEYEKTWTKTENNEHSNVRINKVADNTYDVMSTYSFFSLKDQKQKRVDSKIRFVFNKENKIIRSYGL